MHVEILKEKDKALYDFVNTVTEYAIRNNLTMKVIDEGIEKVREIFYSDAFIKREKAE